MSCSLCFEINENLFQVSSLEGLKLNAEAILQKYFKFCFQNEDNSGWICRKCWCQVEIFHNFYVRIESIHRSLIEYNETVFTLPLNSLNSSSEVTEFKTENIKRPVLITSKLEHQGEPVAEHEVYPNTNSSGERLIEDRILQKHGSESEETPKKRLSRKIKCNRMKCKCHACGVYCLSLNELRRHIKVKHQVLPYKCTSSLCIESFAIQENLDNHMKEAHVKIKCPHCDKKVPQKSLSEHIRSFHLLKYQMLCDLCGHVSRNSQQHARHYMCKHDSETRCQCDICGNWVNNRRQIWRHMQNMHIQKPIPCPICEKICPNMPALFMHKKTHSEGYKRFRCPVCDNVFRDAYTLKEHSKVHLKTLSKRCKNIASNRKTYKCEDCDNEYLSRQSRWYHRRKIHLGGKQ